MISSLLRSVSNAYVRGIEWYFEKRSSTKILACVQPAHALVKTICIICLRILALSGNFGSVFDGFRSLVFE